MTRPSIFSDRDDPPVTFAQVVRGVVAYVVVVGGILALVKWL